MTSAALDGRAGIVTGAASGIGRASALALAAAGAAVVLADTNAEAGAQAAAELAGAGAEASFVECDVSSDQQVHALVAATLERHGRLDFAVNNAGIEGPFASMIEVTEADWDRTVAVDLKGVWLCMRHELPPMLAAGAGAIVNTSSVGGLVGLPGSTPYTAAKHGVTGQLGNGLDFYQSVRVGERADLHQRARRAGVAEVTAAHRVDGFAVGHVPQIDTDLDDVVEAGAGGRQDGGHVVQHLLRLPDHVTGADQFSVGSDRQHPGDVQEPAGLHRVRVVADGFGQLPGQPDPPHEGSAGAPRTRIRSGLGWNPLHGLRSCGHAETDTIESISVRRTSLSPGRPVGISFPNVRSG